MLRNQEWDLNTLKISGLFRAFEDLDRYLNFMRERALPCPEIGVKWLLFSVSGFGAKLHPYTQWNHLGFTYSMQGGSCTYPHMEIPPAKPSFSIPRKYVIYSNDTTLGRFLMCED
jgi:hypothetical protein